MPDPTAPQPERRTIRNATVIMPDGKVYDCTDAELVIEPHETPGDSEATEAKE